MDVINLQIKNSIKQQGFGLLEVVLVIVLIAIVAAFANVRWSSNFNLNAQAQQLASDIRYTQALAMSKGQRYRLTLNTGSNTYTIASVAGTTVNNLVTGATTNSLNTGISFGTIDQLPNNIIAFDSQGAPYIDSSATTALTTTATINLTSNGRTQSVQINPAGRVVIP